MAQAAIERNLTRPSSGMLDSWKRSNHNEVHKRNRKASSSIILPEPVNEKDPSEVQPAEKKEKSYHPRAGERTAENCNKYFSFANINYTSFGRGNI